MNTGSRIKNVLKNIDWLLIALVLALVAYGTVAILNVSSSAVSGDELSFWEVISELDFTTAKLHLTYFAIGVVVAIGLLFIDYNNLRFLTPYLYWAAVAVLLLVKFFGKEVNGTSGWFQIGSRNFQPAEFCKIILILVMAKEFAKRTEGGGSIRTFRDFFPLLWRILIPVVLIAIQPDWGSAMVYIVIFVGLLLVARTSLKLIGIFVLGTGALIPLSWFIMADYQKERILSFINPQSGTSASENVMLAKNVIKAGGMTGKGLFSPDLLTQNPKYLPGDDTDFIFASLSEAVGFWGILILSLLYLLLFLKLIHIAVKAKDDFGTYIVLGVLFMLFFHTFENVSMNLGLLPVTGIPLPFISYGGSNLLTSVFSLSFVLNVRLRNGKHSLNSPL